MTIGAEQGRSEYREGDSPAKAASLEKRGDTLRSQHDGSIYVLSLPVFAEIVG